MKIGTLETYRNHTITRMDDVEDLFGFGGESYEVNGPIAEGGLFYMPASARKHIDDAIAYAKAYID